MIIASACLKVLWFTNLLLFLFFLFILSQIIKYWFLGKLGKQSDELEYQFLYSLCSELRKEPLLYSRVETEVASLCLAIHPLKEKKLIPTMKFYLKHRKEINFLLKEKKRILSSQG